MTVPFLDSVRDPVAILTRDGKIVGINSSFLSFIGAPKEDLVGMDCRELEPLGRLWNNIAASIFGKSGKNERINLGGKTFEVFINPMNTGGDITHVSVLFRDISALADLERDFLKKSKELIITNTLSSTFISSSDLDTVLNDLLEKVLLVTDFRIGWVAMKVGGNFGVKTMSGVSAEFKRNLEAGRLDGLYERFIKSGDPLFVIETPEVAEVEELRKEGIVFLAAIPLRSNEHITGFLILASRVDFQMDFDMASLLSLTGNTVSLIVEKVRLFQETQLLAITDSLTGLFNVRYFYETLSKEIARTLRYSTPFSIALMDIDNFKLLNDTYGHQAGDEVLRSIAEMLKKSARGTDIIARYGGEEFIIILTNTGKNEAFHLACRIRDSVEAESFLPERVRISLSGGIATFPEDASDAKELLYAADMAMYDAKAAGKKTILCYSKKTKQITT